MIFRERSKKIHVIKTVYNPEKGRGEQKTMCKFSSDITHFELTFTAALIAELEGNGATKDEMDEVRAYVLQHAEEAKIQRSIKGADSVIDNVKNALFKLNDEETAKLFTIDRADEIFSTMKKIRDRLRDLGYVEKRTKKK